MQGQWTGNTRVWEPDGIQEDSGRCYALTPEKDSYVRRFELRLRSGRSISIPYALLPIIDLGDNKSLRIVTHDLRVEIEGRNLGVLRNELSEERVTWIRESRTGKDTGESDVFISKITFECEFMD